MMMYTTAFTTAAIAAFAPAYLHAQEVEPANKGGLETLQKIVDHLKKTDNILKSITDTASAEKAVADLEAAKQEAKTIAPDGNLNLNISEEEAQANAEQLQSLLSSLQPLGESIEAECKRIQGADYYGNDALRSFLENSMQPQQ